jgi:hypothetical protein
MIFSHFDGCFDLDYSSVGAVNNSKVLYELLVVQHNNMLNTIIHQMNLIARNYITIVIATRMCFYMAF